MISYSRGFIRAIPIIRAVVTTRQRVFGLGLSWLVGVWIVAEISGSILPGMSAGRPWSYDITRRVTPLTRWDSGWYVNLAKAGYREPPTHVGQETNHAFFPLYPALIRLVVRTTGLETSHAGTPGPFGPPEESAAVPLRTGQLTQNACPEMRAAIASNNRNRLGAMARARTTNRLSVDRLPAACRISPTAGRGATRSCLLPHLTHNAEPDVIDICWAGTVGGVNAVLVVRRAEAAAFQNVLLPVLRRHWIGKHLSIVGVGYPLPDVAEHVVDAPRIRLLSADH